MGMITKERWNELVLENGGEFLQSWQWGEFQEILGHKVIRIFNEELGLAQIIITKLPFGLARAYIPRGPIFFSPHKVKEFISFIFNGLPKNTIFISIEPHQFIPGIYFDASKAKQPVQTSILNLEKTEEELLLATHSKTRYSIRVAQKNNLKIKEISAADFYNLLAQTASRQKFKTYPKEYFEKINKVIGSPAIRFLGVCDGPKILAGGLFYLFGDRATYLHGGSDYDSRALMGPHFLHWEAIKLFKSESYGRYDFWGIDQTKWPGLTRFKMGFGGSVKKYPGTYIKILRLVWYSLYRLAQKR